MCLVANLKFTPVGNERLLLFDKDCRPPGVSSLFSYGGLYRLVAVLKYHRKVLLRDVLVSLKLWSSAQGVALRAAHAKIFITCFRISKRWDRLLANLLGETLVQ